MKYSQEQLTKIEQFAMLYTKPSEIAIFLDVPEEEFKADINSEGHPARKAYIKGKLSHVSGRPPRSRCPKRLCSIWKTTNNAIYRNLSQFTINWNNCAHKILSLNG